VISWQRSGSGIDLFTTYNRSSMQEQQWVSNFLAEEPERHRSLHRLLQKFHAGTAAGKVRGRGVAAAQISSPPTPEVPRRNSSG
jgi:hypothetical protein